MPHHDPAIFHKLYGIRTRRIVYYKKDFLDYFLMIVLSMLAVSSSYGFHHVIAIVGLALGGFMLVMFAIRHGVEFKTPVLLRRPQEVLYMFAYKVQNLRSVYFIALGVLLLENFLIAATPNLPHHVALMRKIAFTLFYTHLIAISAYRTIILFAHLAKKEMVREILRQTPWQRVIKEETNISLEILHAYCTGLLTHIILIAPWYMVIAYSSFSVVFLPVVCLVNIVVHLKWFKIFNAWFYRDHWLGHNSEFEFIFLHGTHHDAIPSGLIAVAENGFLEGFLRFTIGGFPTAFYNPIISFMAYTIAIKADIDLHQYIPGVFPRIPRRVIETYQHSTHHYGVLEPYSLGGRADPSRKRSTGIAAKLVSDEDTIELDEELTGFKWDNPIYRRILSLYDKYHN